MQKIIRKLCSRLSNSTGEENNNRTENHRDARSARAGRKPGWIPVMLLAAGCLCTGCAKPEQVKTSIKIGVTMYDQYDVFISALNEEFLADAREKSTETGINISIDAYNAASSQSTQDSQVAAMIQNGCDVICVNLVDRTNPSNIITMAKESGTPVIFYNREMVEEDLERWEKLYYVGANAEQSGIMQAETVRKYILDHPETDRNGDGVLTYYMLEGEPGHQDAILRTQSSVDTMEALGIVLDKAGYGIANWSRDQAKSQIDHLYDERQDVELILANNDAMALGAADALENRNIPPEEWPIIFGIDGVHEGLIALAEGRIKGTVYNDKEGQAEAMLELACQLAMGEEINVKGLQKDKYIRLNYEKIMKENVEDYLQSGK